MHLDQYLHKCEINIVLEDKVVMISFLEDKTVMSKLQ